MTLGHVTFTRENVYHSMRLDELKINETMHGDVAFLYEDIGKKKHFVTFDDFT